MEVLTKNYLENTLMAMGVGDVARYAFYSLQERESVRTRLYSAKKAVLERSGLVGRVDILIKASVGAEYSTQRPLYIVTAEKVGAGTMVEAVIISRGEDGRQEVQGVEEFLLSSGSVEKIKGNYTPPVLPDVDRFLTLWREEGVPEHLVLAYEDAATNDEGEGNVEETWNAVMQWREENGL